MNFKEWIAPVSFALIMTFLFQYFFESKIEKNIDGHQVKTGESFIAPAIEDVNKPLRLDVAFVQNESSDVEVLQTVKTSCATYVFSNQGAVLKSCSFPWQSEGMIETVAQDNSCFLLALEKDTPRVYTLEEKEVQDAQQTLVYKAHCGDYTITKTFVVYQDLFKIDLQVSVAYKHQSHDPLQMRLFLTQPSMNPAIKWDKTAAMVNDGNYVTTIDVTKKDSFARYWTLPSLFGLESRFLVHALTQDANNLIQRVYMNKNRDGLVYAILESRRLEDAGSWKLSFFVGPKTSQAMEKVDSRLLKTMNFGWFAPISYPILSFLKFLHEKIGNYGWAIILLTLLLKLLLLPFTLYGEKNMRKGAEMQQKLAYLQKKYQHDPAMFDQQRAELIKKHGVPGLTGCLPLLLTLPILIALNTVLSNAMELYGASFLWIDNLYEVDPYYILPIMTGLVMLGTPMDNDPKKSLMRYIMALMMATITCYLSAGLVLFIFVNSATAALQTRLQKR
jgi:YidC/Oxa1 family membrane protein insertase